MVIVGAGGHASEVFDVLTENSSNKFVFFFDNTDCPTIEKQGSRIFKSFEEIEMELQSGFDFVLGVGNPQLRIKFLAAFRSTGAAYRNIRAASASISASCMSTEFDAMKNSFIGPGTTIGFGTLINTGAQVHHDVSIGEFTEISPRSLVLGGASVGSFTRVGANATVLPKVKIGNNVVVGAGAVVISDLPDNCLAVGVPAIIKQSFL